MYRARTLLLAVVVLGLAWPATHGCRRSGAPAGALKKKPGEQVARIVFVEKKHACDCTKNRTTETWNALQFALKRHPQVKVERIALDVQEKRVRALKKQRRFMVVPALYFFNPEGKLVAMLEGELKPDTIDANLTTKSPAKP